MKKIFLGLLFMSSFCLAAKAQNNNNTQPKKPDYSKIDLSNRANDHLLIQFGYDGWDNQNGGDSINPTGFSRHFNMYFMLDKPFKSNPHFSVGFGVGVGSSNIFFKDTYIDLKANSNTLPFRPSVPNTNSANFKKYKLTTVFAELPVEFRYAGNPVSPNKGFKAAIGAKIGTLLDAHTKGKNLVDQTGLSVYGTKYINKEKDKRFINGTRLAVTGRVGYGIFSIDVSYQVTSLLKDGAGPAIRPYSIGLTISGL
jgi:hypothetical protein